MCNLELQDIINLFGLKFDQIKKIIIFFFLCFLIWNQRTIKIVVDLLSISELIKLQKSHGIFWNELFLKTLVDHSQYVLQPSFSNCIDFFFNGFL
jgi:hypothetical protein